MSSSAPAKLTKKQRKGLAFRERKSSGKGKKRSDLPETGGDVPEEDIVLDDIPEVAVEEKVVNKKRKREDAGEDGDKKVKSPKKPKTESATTTEQNGEGENAASVKGKQKAKPEKTRYILFLGNLKYTTTKEAVESHFSVCDPPPSVRLMTPKATDPSRPVTKSKGCAFLEFTHRNALQQGLKLHHSELEGRKINVELTAGGGGKSESRIQKVRERNRGLETQRKTKQGGEQPETESTAPGVGERISRTSGIEVRPVTKRTWTVPNVEDGETHRGGKKHAKVRGSKGGRPKQPFSTGANAISVG
ncbi:hypothetical protein SISNIDRAFT_464193 [Sistotremastrum niveocremeum HHB9708]|uniref:RRM domain-containing protein n=1 Tax=Sistotremastrum niveocremeum HHB9708 TaxID=1314777 RepID=A0A164XEL8_9AGAM|nr:hypothetical protein SISNIDRAFT_464193 [Sistotremastrum niveocremeum HHB9708]